MKGPPLLLVFVLALAPPAYGQPARPKGPVRVPAEFVIEELARGLTAVTAMDVAPDGRVLVCEQGGTLRVIKEGRLLEEPLLSLKVDSTWERGLIGVTCDPDFARNGFLYVTYVSPTPYPHHVIRRFSAKRGVAEAASEKVLLEGDDQRKMPGTIKNGHQGGALHFGNDGKLYVSIGDQTSNEPAQDLDTFLGKILRLNPDGTIPDDNPFVAEAEGKYRAIYARGCRNVFGFAIDPASGKMLLNDVGGAREEVNVGRAGANYGWPKVEHGVDSKGKYDDAIHSYPFASIVGGDFCHAKGWQGEYQGKYFFADFVHGWIRTLDPDKPAEVKDFAAGIPFPTDIRFSPDGSLYVLVRDMWVNDKPFYKEGTGYVLRVKPKNLD